MSPQKYKKLANPFFSVWLWSVLKQYQANDTILIAMLNIPNWFVPIQVIYTCEVELLIHGQAIARYLSEYWHSASLSGPGHIMQKAHFSTNYVSNKLKLISAYWNDSYGSIWFYMEQRISVIVMKIGCTCRKNVLVILVKCTYERSLTESKAVRSWSLKIRRLSGTKSSKSHFQKYILLSLMQ